MTKDKITDEYIKAVQKQFKHYTTIPQTQDLFLI